MPDDNSSLNFYYGSPDSADITQWPEYKAFAKRLGIDVARPTKYLRLTLEMGYPAEIEHNYLGMDTAEYRRIANGEPKT